MGYSIMTPCRDPEVKSTMMLFLGKHYRSPDTFLRNMEDDGLRGPIDTGFAYSNDEDARPMIGFDYTSWAPGREFATALCRWIALRVGEEKAMPVFEGNEESDLVAELPYYIYDGYEDIPVRRRSKWLRVAPKVCRTWTFVDEHGWDPIKKSGFMRALHWGPARNQQHKELKRLSELWEVYPCS
jgi:hypothetical protein